MADGSIALYSKVNRRIYMIPIKELTLDMLCLVGSWEVRSRVSRTIEEGKIPFKSLKSFLICKGGDNYLGNLREFGQGIHMLRDKRLLIVNGDEAVIYDGRQFIPQEYPIIDHQYIRGDNDLRWVDMHTVKAMTLNMNSKKAHKIIDSLLSVVSEWQFNNPLDNVLVTGWIIAQVVQSAWDWRPQLWISGSSGSGKTMLTQLVEGIAGNLSCRLEGNGLTEPGLRQVLKDHAFCTIIDEFEMSPHRERIIERLRSAGRGGRAAIGSTRQKAIVSHIRHMFLVASIETGMIRAAEQYRYLQVYTRKDPLVKPTIPATKELERLQLEIVSYALWAIYRARDLIANFEGITNYDNRWVESVMVPFSMIAAYDEDPPEAMRKMVTDYLNCWSKEHAGEDLEDEASLIQDILFATIRISEQIETEDGYRFVYVNRTIGQLLDQPELSEEHHKTMQANGIRLTEKRELFIYPEKVRQNLLSQTRWAKLNLRDILLRIEGAQRSRQYLAGIQIRGVLLSPKSWMQK